MEEINIDLSDSNEVVDLKIDDIDDIPSFPKTDVDTSLDVGKIEEPPSMDIGSGIELLMNEKRKESSESKKPKVDEDLLELDSVKLDDSLGGGNDEGMSIVSNTKNLNSQSKVTSTWDGFSKLDTASPKLVEEKPLSKEEVLKEKFTYLRKLEALEQKGVQLTKKYTMDSPLNEMKGEYENIIAEKERKNSVRFQGKVLTALITGVEFLNNRFDPFDFKLDGWSENVNENLDDYDEIFSELYEKYKSKTSMSPELKLIFQLSASGMMIHMSNSMFKSALPGMDDIMRQNPDLMQHFTNAAMQSMQQQSPGMSNFMNEFVPQRPPPPMPTQPDINRVVDVTNASDNSGGSYQPLNTPKPQEQRREMSGPTNVENLLSGLKKKKTTKSQSMSDIDDLASQVPKPKKKKEKTSISLEL